jgi:DNA-binding transcriptional ArsR family regulator
MIPKEATPPAAEERAQFVEVQRVKGDLPLTYSHIGILFLMPRAATTSDSFNAVAEPRRREILNFLAPAERPVGAIVVGLGFPQPSVSKHLRVLLDVGLVEVRRDGRQAFYRTNAEAIKPVHEWTSRFERYWRHQLTRVKGRAEQQSKRSEKNSTRRRQP